MSSQNKKFTFKKVFIAALISLLVLSAFLFGRLDSITDSTPGGHKTVLPGDDGKIYASLHDKEQSSVAVYPEISNEQVIALLNEATNQQSDYTWYYKSTLISRDRSLSENGILKSSDNTYRVDIFDGNNTLQKTVEVNDAVMSVQLFNVASGQSEKDFSSESASIFEEIGVPEIYDFINSEDKDFSFSFIDSDFGKLLFASFTSVNGNYSQHQEYYISLDYALVVRADCFENDIPVYTLETVSLYRQNEGI